MRRLVRTKARSDDGKRVSAKTVASHALCERSDKGVGSEGGKGAHDRLMVSRRLRAEGRFECDLQYFRKVTLNKGDIISEGLLEASKEPFWSHFGSPFGVSSSALGASCCSPGVPWDSLGGSLGRASVSLVPLVVSYG